MFIRKGCDRRDVFLCFLKFVVEKVTQNKYQATRPTQELLNLIKHQPNN